MKKPLDHNQNSQFILEELEPRQLFSGGIEGVLISELELPVATYISIDESGEQTALQQDQIPELTTDTQSQEIVFVDTKVDNYQTLVDDIINNTDNNRHIKVYLLDSQQNGIKQISDTLLNYDDLDAIHIISHGEDGNIQLGNTRLYAETLTENNLAIALWTESFTETGDILIYGCNLAETEIGQNLVDGLSQLTQTDVAASDDLTGNSTLGGNWELEYKSGSIETNLAISTSSQQDWLGVFAGNPPTASGGNVTGIEDNAIVFIWSDFNVSDIDTSITSQTAVRIDSLPTSGTLQYYNGSTWISVSSGQLLTKATVDAGLVRFEPFPDEAGYDDYFNPGLGDRFNDYAQFSYTPIHSTSLGITNPGGESDVYPEGGWSNTLTGWANSGLAGSQNITDTTFPLDHDNVLFTDGSNGTLTQTLGTTFSSSNDYSLSLEVGSGYDANAYTFEVQLFAGATQIGVIDQTGFARLNSQLVSGTLTVDGSVFSALNGQALKIRLVGLTAQSNYDNLTLRSFARATDEGAIATMNIDLIPVNDAPIDLSATPLIHDIESNPITIIGAQTGTQNTTATLTSLRTVTISVSSGDIYAQLANADGSLIGDAFRVFGATDNDLNSAVNPVVAALPDGGFIVVAEGEGYTNSGDYGTAIQGMVFDEGGNAILVNPTVELRDIFLISYGSSGGTEQRSPTLDVAGDGTITVQWQNTTAGTFEQRAFSIVGPSVDENAPAGTLVSTLLSVDPDSDDTQTYSIVGADTNFEIVGNELRVKASASLDYETTPSHSITLRVTDSGGLTHDETLTITVNDTNDAPTTTPVTLTAIAEDSGVRLITQAELLSNATDVDGPSLTATNLAIATGVGTLVDNLDGTWNYTPVLNDDTAVTFTYTVTDSLLTAAGTASLDITPINDTPSSTNATILAPTNSTFVFNANLFNFSDVDSTDSLQQVRISSIAGSGSLQINGAAVLENQVITRADIDAGLLTFTPIIGESGSNYASFNFEVHDGTAFAGATSSATINVSGLTPFFNQRIQGGGLVVDSAGIRADASFTGGTLTPILTISGIPAGATVVNAYLLINELDHGSLDTTFTLDGNALTVNQVGESTSPGWGASRVVTFRADVSTLVTGNGSYSLGGAGEIGADAYEGASLVVVYEDTSVTTDSIITLHEGSVTQLDSPVTIPIEFNAGNPLPQSFLNANMTLVAFDGQDFFPDVAIDFQATSAGSATTIIPTDSFDSDLGRGEQFTIDISALITQTDTGADLTQTTPPTNSDDYLVYPFIGTVIQLDNAAPTLDDTGLMALTSITEDQTNSVGDIISDVILSAGGDRITDLDNGALEGIAITSLSSANGSWEYSTNAGVSWSAVGIVSDASALLLRNSDFLRFIPDGLNADSANFDFRAWDHTSGLAGNKVDTNTNGGTTAFSTATETANITVTSVNDQLTTNISINQTKTYNEGSADVGLDNIVVTDVDSGETITATLTLNDPTFGALSTSGSASYSAATGVWTITDSVAVVNTALANVTFNPALNNDQNTTVSVSIVDGGENGTTAATGTITLNVTGINDVPVITNSAGTFSYTEQNSAVVIDAGLTLTDPDGKNGLTNAPNFSAVVRISNNFDPNDVLNFSNTANIQGNLVGDTLTLTVVPAQTATVADFEAALRSVTYYNGNDDPSILDRTVSFSFNDGLASSNIHTRTIQFTAVNDFPAVATNTGTTVSEGTTDNIITTTMLNEGDPDDAGIGLTYTVTTIPANGILKLNGTTLNNGNTFTQDDVDNNRITYDHDGSETTTDSFVFALADSAVALTGQTFNITITSINDAPINNVPGAQAVNEDTNLVFNNSNLISITDVDAGSTLRITLTSTNGLVTLSQTVGLTFTVGDGIADSNMTFEGSLTDINTALDGLSFIGDQDFNGTANIQITTDDLSLITLNEDVNQQGYYTFNNTGNLGNDNSVGGANDGTVNGAVSTNDAIRGDVLSFDGNDDIKITGLFGSPTEVTLAGWVNLDSGFSDNHIISLGDNIGIVADEGSNGVSGYFHDRISTLSTPSNQSIAGAGWHHVAYTFSDSGNVQTLYLDGIEMGSTNFTTPPFNFQGPDTYIGRHGNAAVGYFHGKIDDARIYDRALTASEIQTLVDGQVTTDTDNIVITVNADNDLTVVVDDSVSTNEDTAVDIAVLTNDTDVDIAATLVSATNGMNGSTSVNTTTGVVTYTPNANFNGSDSFTYTNSDNTVGTVTVTVSAINDPTIVVNDNANTTEDTAVDIAVLTNDTDVDIAATLVSAMNGANGSTSVNTTTGVVTYTPNANFNGSDSFTYINSDNTAGTVTVTVGAVNDPTLVVNDSANTNEDTAVDILVLTNDTDVDIAATLVSATNGTNGSTSVNTTTGVVTYTPNANFNGSDSFTYTNSDNTVGTVTVTVSAVNVPLLAINDSFTTLEDTPITTKDVVINDTLSDETSHISNFDAISISGGIVINNADNTFTYIPPANFNGSDSFTYTLKDLEENLSTATVTISVLAVNDTPVISGNSEGFITENITTLSENFSVNNRLHISDPDTGESNFISTIIKGNYGQLSIDSSGNWSYKSDFSQAELQQLALSNNLTDILTVTTTDGSHHDIVISIKGNTETDDTNNNFKEDISNFDPLFSFNLLFSIDITMTTQLTENTTTLLRPDKPQSSDNASKFVSNLNDEISQMLEELNNVSLDSSDSPWFEKPEYDLGSYAEFDEDEDSSFVPSTNVSKSKQHTKNLKNSTSPAPNLTVGQQKNFDENEDQALWKKADKIREQMEESSVNNEDIEVKVALGASVSLTAGIVSWFLRGGALLASLMSALPFINRFDPLPILKEKEKTSKRKIKSKKTSRTKRTKK